MFNKVEYGHKVLSKFGKVINRDYNKILNSKYASTRGVSLLIYIDELDMNVGIKYLLNDIIFEIDINSNEIMRSSWKNEDVSEYVMSFFEFIVRKTINDIQDRKDHIKTFTNKKWVNLENKISKILVPPVD